MGLEQATDVRGRGSLAIEARDLERTYGGKGGLGHVTLEVPPGVIVGLVGPSGCGKTTLIRVLAGISRPTGGEVRVLGREPAHFTNTDRARLGYMPQQSVLFPTLSVWQNLGFAASLNGVGLRRRRRMKDLLTFVGLLGDRRKLLARCSGGMQRRLALAATLVHDPELLLLDEPTAGIDPILRERFWDRFRQLRDQGRTLLVSTQYVGEAAECDLVAVMDHGRLVTFGTPQALRQQAFGGDVVEVRPQQGWLTRQELGRIAAEPWAISVTQRAETVVVVVADAEATLPLVVAHFERAGLAVDAIEATVPSYDDVFVALIEANGGGDGPEAPGDRRQAA